MEAFFSRHHPAQHAASRAQEEGCQQIPGLPGFSTVESSINSYKPQKCGIFLSNFIFLYVACVACLWYNGLEVIMIEALF